MPVTATEQLQNLLGSTVFLSTFMSWLLAQIIKTLIDVFRHRVGPSRDLVASLLWKTGGMPSSHSSMVTSLALSCGFVFGFHSSAFLISFFYGGLVIRDAMGVRLAAGRQAQQLNRLGRELEERSGIPFQPVKEINGHTPAEVAIGALVGCSMAVAFHFL